ncbi:MAG: hypothetical protein HYV34_00940 [Candidatus Kerfeldbacteria bacterium]|nr:hypothetical protein [Candidatus Kerfeldbacteria bacterium]
MSQQRPVPNRDELTRYGNELATVIKSSLERLARYSSLVYFHEALAQVGEENARERFAMTAFADANRGVPDAEILHTSLNVLGDISRIPMASEDNLLVLWRWIAEGSLFVLSYLFSTYVRTQPMQTADIAEACVRLGVPQLAVVEGERPIVSLLYPPSVSRQQMNLSREGVSRLALARRSEGKLALLPLDTPHPSFD